MNAIFAEGNPLQFLADLGVEWPMLLGQGLSFALMAAALWYFVLRPVLKTAEERQAKIEQGLKDAQDAAARRAAAEEEARKKITQSAVEAAALLEKTRQDAAALIEGAKAQSAQAAAQIQKQAAEQIELDRKKMRDELRGEISQLVVKTTVKLVGEVLTPEQKSKLADLSAQKLDADK